MWAHFKHLSSKIFSMVRSIHQSNEFWPLQSLFRHSRVHWDSNFKVEAHLRVCGFIPSQLSTFSGAWNVTLELHFWPTPLWALALVASPKLELWHLLLARPFLSLALLWDSFPSLCLISFMRLGLGFGPRFVFWIWANAFSSLLHLGIVLVLDIGPFFITPSFKQIITTNHN